jgi:hypothetical protein
MKFILSPKGFDSSWGGHACPILSRHLLLPLPIPVDPCGEFASADRVTYRDLAVPGRNMTYEDIMRAHGIATLTVGGKKATAVRG